MTQQNELENIVKAAVAGYTHELISRGYDTTNAAKAAIVYAHPEGGMLQKRANLREQFARDVVAVCKGMH